MSDSDSTEPEHHSAGTPGAADARRALWRNGDFVGVMAGETVSELGSHVGSLALALAAALTLQATPGQMAALRAAEYLSRVVTGPLAGVWVDRLRRRPVLIATNIGRAALMLAVAAAAVAGVLRIEVLYAVGVVMAALGVVFGTAMVAYFPALVPARHLVAANGARATGSAATDVAGPGLGGALVQAAGAPTALALDGLSFLASALGLTLVRASEPPPPPRAERRRLDFELLDGARTLVGDPILRAFLATMFTAQFFYSAIMAVYVLFLTRELGLSPAALGAIFGLGGGVGLLAGSAAASPATRVFGLGRTLVGSHFLFGVLGIPLALAAAWPSQGAALVFAAEFAQLAANAVYGVNRTSVEQAVTPPRLRGRVQAGRRVAHALAGMLGIALGGAIGEWVGLREAIAFGVFGGLFSFLWLWFSPVRRLRALPAPSE